MKKKNKKLKLLDTLFKQDKDCITKIIPFTNNDVPNFLKRLAKFERASRKHNIIIT